MELQFHSTVLFCQDVQKQKEFYTQFLGQEIELDHGHYVVLKNHLTLWQIGDDYPIARELGYAYEPIGNRNLEVCFETDAFGDAVEKVLMADIRILHNVAEEPWGQYTIRFYDPEGNLVEIGESMKSMAGRMKDAGMTIEDMVKKTSLSVTYIKKLLE
jgi:catechol 2,3-dioxygenase-like lactoylglutathione lyase family enzyme